jgi:hypothetical protein
MRTRSSIVSAVARLVAIAALSALLFAGLNAVTEATPAHARPVVAHVDTAKAKLAKKRRIAHRIAVRCRAMSRSASRHLGLAHARPRHARVHRQQSRRLRKQAAQCRRRLLPKHRTVKQPAQPSAAAPVAAAAASGGGFGAGRWPGADWRPYAASSPFNVPVGGAGTHPLSAQMVASALANGSPATMVAGTADTADDWAHPVYFAQSSDPVYTLHATAPWGRASIEGMRIAVPAGARPAGGGDGHMTVVTPDGWEYDLWQAKQPPAGGGTLSFSWGGRLRVDGDGLSDGGTAARFGSLAGVIRPEELAAGRIEHALFIVLKCNGSGANFGYDAKVGSDGSGYVYPAADGDAPCADRNAAPMGARFQLAMSDAQIAGLAVPAWKKTILTALAHYGGYVGDTGGPGFTFMFQSGSTYTSFGVADPLVSIAQSAGIASQGGRYGFNIADGVEWSKYLRVVTPPSR